MPMLKLMIGGTEGAMAKSEEARRRVPSPPKVVMRSVLRGREKVEAWIVVVEEEEEEGQSRLGKA